MTDEARARAITLPEIITASHAEADPAGRVRARELLASEIAHRDDLLARWSRLPVDQRLSAEERRSIDLLNEQSRARVIEAKTVERVGKVERGQEEIKAEIRASFDGAMQNMTARATSELARDAAVQALAQKLEDGLAARVKKENFDRSRKYSPAQKTALVLGIITALCSGAALIIAALNGHAAVPEHQGQPAPMVAPAHSR